LLLSLLPSAVAADPFAPCAYNQSDPAAGKLLVASRDMDDPYFRHRVIYLLAHGNEGTIGLIINQPLGIALSQILSDDMAAEIGADNTNRHEVRFGGPVLMMHLMMLARDQTDRTQMQCIDHHTYFSEDRRAIARVLKQGQGDDHARFFVGHAGWSPGQLEVELLAGAWFVIEADEKSLFSDDTGDLWEKLIEELDPPGLLVEAIPGENPVKRLEKTGWSIPYRRAGAP
jgi:putative transcriptional regulator